MDFIDDQGFRANVGIILTDGGGRVLIAGRRGRGGWQFPQGGIHPEESTEAAMFRELREEVGLAPSDVELVGSTEGWLKYRPLGRLLAARQRSGVLQATGLRARAAGARAAGVSKRRPATPAGLVAASLATRAERAHAGACMTQGRSKPIVIAVLATLVAAGSLYLAFELGRYQSGYSVLDQRRERAASVERLAAEQTANDELRRQLAIVETGSEIDAETYAQVKSTLSELQAQIQAQEEELVFFRGIVSPQDRVAGLRIQSLEVLPSDGEDRYLLRLLLVQAIVHSRLVSGNVKLQLEGVRDGQTTSFDVAELVAAGTPYDMAYEFRYFQGLETELTLPLGFEPQRVTVEIWPNEARADRINQTFDWPSSADERTPE